MTTVLANYISNGTCGPIGSGQCPFTCNLALLLYPRWFGVAVIWHLKFHTWGFTQRTYGKAVEEPIVLEILGALANCNCYKRSLTMDLTYHWGFGTHSVLCTIHPLVLGWKLGLLIFVQKFSSAWLDSPLLKTYKETTWNCLVWHWQVVWMFPCLWISLLLMSHLLAPRSTYLIPYRYDNLRF
jgi:hypothetical protein